MPRTRYLRPTCGGRPQRGVWTPPAEHEPKPCARRDAPRKPQAGALATRRPRSPPGRPRPSTPSAPMHRTDSVCVWMRALMPPLTPKGPEGPTPRRGRIASANRIIMRPDAARAGSPTRQALVRSRGLGGAVRVLDVRTCGRAQTRACVRRAARTVRQPSLRRRTAPRDRVTGASVPEARGRPSHTALAPSRCSKQAGRHTHTHGCALSDDARVV